MLKKKTLEGVFLGSESRGTTAIAKITKQFGLFYYPFLTFNGKSLQKLSQSSFFRL